MAHNSGRLAGKTALVTAAAAGIGRETALLFAREGAKVVATDLNEGQLEALQQEGSDFPDFKVAHLDVTDAEAAQRIVAAGFDGAPFDVVFNCAGWVHDGGILACNDEAWRRSFSVNVDSMYIICRSAIPAMLRNGGGSIINMSSVASSIKGLGNRFAYGASKAAVIGLTRAIAAEFAGNGVRANAVCPGTVNTPSLALRVAAQQGDVDDIWSAFRARQPMGRLAEAAEIALLVLYLASDESAFTTGAVHVIDGGWTA